ncbi:MAG: Fic family protein [Candidatus Methanomethylophilaceae archaeon]|nr:Fic family protein [Candidatus Methanomethylophilaceae archaeon]MBR6213252.1 Fic family protein [Candidatus Methanomethylophilaceae archaeon]
MNESLDKEDFDIMKEIWTVSALDGIRGSFYSKELIAAEKEIRVTNALLHDTESIPVGEARIRSLLDGDAPMTHNEHLISGYDRAMNMVMKDYSRLDFNEKSLLTLHRVMFAELLCEKGKFRSGCENAMEFLFEDYNSKTTEALAYIPRTLENFSQIAPFQDGNKRMRSLLTNLLLLRNGYTAQFYVGLDETMPLLPSLMRSYKELDRRYPIVENRKVKKRDRILHIIETSSEPVKKKDICACIPDVSIRTADVVLSDLIEQNKIEKLGSYKDARYILV